MSFPFQQNHRREYRRSRCEGAVPARSVTRDIRIYLSRPCVDAAAQRLHVFKALVTQPCGHVERSLSVMTENGEVLLGIKLLVRPPRNVAHRHEGAGVNMGG